jgi:hypothetical protein
MKQFFLVLLGPSWKSSLMGVGEAVAVQALTYTLNTQYHDPRVFWSGMGLSILTIIRGRLTKDWNVSNSPVPMATSQVVTPVAAVKTTLGPKG